MRTIIAVVLGVSALLALLAVLAAGVGTVLSLIRRRPLRGPLSAMLVFGLVFVVTSLGALFASGSGEEARVRDDEQLRQEEEQQPEGQEERELPAAIPGLTGDEVASAFEQNGLECTPHVPQEGGRLLSTCTSADNPDLHLLYEGEIFGSGPQRPVEGVEAQVSMTGDGGDLEMASKGFFGTLGALLEYEGSNSDEVFTFVNENMSATEEQSIVIGSAKWRLISTEESKTLEITSAP